MKETDLESHEILLLLSQPELIPLSYVLHVPLPTLRLYANWEVALQAKTYGPVDFLLALSVAIYISGQSLERFPLPSCLSFARAALDKNGNC
jgi:hypothetical protein